MKTILFQGDSITDAGRSRENDAWLGCGYATMAAGAIAEKHPGAFRFYNRGVSGDRVVDLYARIRMDTINLSPDYLTVLIGVNDVGHEFAHQNGVSAEKFEMVYDLFLSEVREALPQTKIVLLGAFLLNREGVPSFDLYLSEVKKRAAAARRLADKYALPFIPLQEALNDLERRIPPEDVSRDGLHPALAGHARIAALLTEELEKLF